MVVGQKPRASVQTSLDTTWSQGYRLGPLGGQSPQMQRDFIEGNDFSGEGSPRGHRSLKHSKALPRERSSFNYLPEPESQPNKENIFGNLLPSFPLQPRFWGLSFTFRTKDHSTE